jgi:hypothetical protein
MSKAIQHGVTIAEYRLNHTGGLQFDQKFGNHGGGDFELSKNRRLLVHRLSVFCCCFEASKILLSRQKKNILAGASVLDPLTSRAPGRLFEGVGCPSASLLKPKSTT